MFCDGVFKDEKSTEDIAKSLMNICVNLYGGLFTVEENTQTYKDFTLKFRNDFDFNFFKTFKDTGTLRTWKCTLNSIQNKGKFDIYKMETKSGSYLHDTQNDSYEKILQKN